MNFKKKISICALVIVLLLGLGITTIPQIQEQGTANLVLDNDFSLSETTYTNKSMRFQVADPYEGNSYFTYESGGTVQAPSDNMYAMDTDVSGYAEFFGFDEFVDHSVVSSSVWFKTTLLAGTYHFVPLGYFYQKTVLETNTHWALAVYWDSTGCDLYYNTANGATPSSVSLFATAPGIGNPYNITLQNFGDQTFVQVYDTVAHSNLYSGYITTPTYDATSLYAGFGQYSSGNGHIYGWRDDFFIFDTIVDTPTNGSGLSTINAYIDEVFTHTFYDIVTGYNSTLVIDSAVTNITLVVQCWLNGTAFDIDTISQGVNQLRHNVTVTNLNNTVMFTQSNFTYSWGIEYGDGLFLFEYWVQLDFTVAMSEIYKTIISMEVYY